MITDDIITGMPFIFQQVLDEGTRNPIVARLGPQAADISQWLNVDKSLITSVKHLYLDTLTQRLIACWKRREQLAKKINLAQEEFQARGVDRYRLIPGIMDLKQLAEGFLYDAKLYLRDLLELFSILYECPKNEASDFYSIGGKPAKLITWLKHHVPEAQLLVELVDRQDAWIGEVVKMRNAIEHAGGKSGTLFIQNITVSAIGGLTWPTWHRDTQHQAPIIDGMDIILSNLLTFSEDLLTQAVMCNPSFPGIEFYLIPPEERNPECPVRLRAAFPHLKAPS